MRKLVWTALILGTVELLKREANRRSITLSALLTNFAGEIIPRLGGNRADFARKT
jgi:hypothetical protein